MQGAEAISKAREMLGRPRSSADFSPAARYTVSKLCENAECRLMSGYSASAGIAEVRWNRREL